MSSREQRTSPAAAILLHLDWTKESLPTETQQISTPEVTIGTEELFILLSLTDDKYLPLSITNRQVDGSEFSLYEI